MARYKRDIFAEFYDALEEAGEYCVIHAGRYRAGMPAPEWTLFRHQEHDGLSVLAHLVRTNENVEIDIQTSPNPPSSWSLVVAFVRLMLVGLRRRPPMRWRRLDRSWRPVAATPAPPTAVAWSLFSKEETLRLEELARSRGVSVNAWLLWALKEAIVSELVPGTGVLAWHMPVNLRGAFSSEGEKGNSNFSLEVTFPPEAGPEQVHKAIRQELRLRRHWVIAKWMFSFGWILGPWIFRRIVRFAATLTPWQGSFSNTGAIVPRDADAAGDPEQWWIGLNPVVKSSPLGAGCVEWRGRMALSVQIHPALATDPQVARDWMSSWRRFAEGGERSG